MSAELNALERVELRNDFYKDGFRKVIIIALGSVILNIILGISQIIQQVQ